MSCPYTSPQNGKVERIIHSVNNVIRTLLIQASLLGRYWAEGLHTPTYLVKVVLQHFHQSRYGSSPLWFFCGEGL
jgi:hypothetical protein